MKRGELKAHIERLAESVAEQAGLEIVEVELKGSGRHQLLRVTIDKPGTDPTAGVTHGDCELLSRELGARLDAEDPIEGAYDLEVTSPGIERKLTKWRDWERFEGQKAKVILKEPVEGDLKHFTGIIAQAAPGGTNGPSITMRLDQGREVTFPFALVERANLKFDW
ncbi:MAG: ribosome maturation factor RimP [Acidobacteriota bacterium]|nr:ribosome maturation factor RimP [Acidobacteriota bacterium]